MTTTTLAVAAFFLIANLALGFCAGVLWTLRRADRLKEEKKVDPMSFLYRAQGIQTQMTKVKTRAERAIKEGDTDALEAAERESELLLERMADIRLEQIAALERGEL